MSTAKQIFIEIIRRPFKTILMCFTVFILVVFTVFGSFIRGISGNIYSDFVRLEGYSVDVQIDEFKELSDWNIILEQLMGLEHVVGYNNTHEARTLCNAVDFTNVDFHGNEAADTGRSRMVYLVGNCNTEYYSSFRNEEMKLIDGLLPSTENPGAAIDINIAEKNNLNIGDSICVSLYGTEFALNIIGIYETLIIPRVEADTEGFYMDSINSFLFCDYENYVKLAGKCDINLIRFYIDEYDNMKKCRSEMKELISEQNALVVDTIENHAANTGTLIPVLNNCSSIVLYINYIVCITILGLLIILWIRGHSKMIIIYKILGQNEYKITGKIIGEIFIIELVSGIMGFASAALFLKHQGRAIIDRITTVSGNKTVMMNLADTEGLYSFHASEAAGFVGVLLLISMVIAFFAGIYMSFMKVQKLKKV